jgi:hypothetical protein
VIALARIGCERAYCGAECQVPSAAALAGADDDAAANADSAAGDGASDGASADGASDGGP